MKMLLLWNDQQPISNLDFPIFCVVQLWDFFISTDWKVHSFYFCVCWEGRKGWGVVVQAANIRLASLPTQLPPLTWDITMELIAVGYCGKQPSQCLKQHNRWWEASHGQIQWSSQSSISGHVCSASCQVLKWCRREKTPPSRPSFYTLVAVKWTKWRMN